MRQRLQRGSRRPAEVRAGGASAVARTGGARHPPATVERARRLGHQVTRLVQREVDLDDAEYTENWLYQVLPDARETLYSEPTAPPPRPEGLFTRTTEDVAGSGFLEVSAWVPNIRLLSNAERQLSETGNLPEGAVAAMRQDIEGVPDLDVDRMPNLGMIGKNDCGFFATALQHLIVESGEIELDDTEEERTLDVSDWGQGREADQAVDVGWRMVHQFQGSEDFERHAATVVAKDSPSLVTLEGHVGQDLTRPKFHVREGATGFAADNLRDLQQDLGSQVSVRRPSEERALGTENMPGIYENEDMWSYGLGSKGGLHLVNLDRAVRALVFAPEWADKGQSLTLKGWKWDKVPKQVTRMRGALNGEGDPNPILARVRDLAREALADPPLIGDRHPLTTRAYRVLAGLSLKRAEVPGLLRGMSAVASDL